jgi:hypothetical protein
MDVWPAVSAEDSQFFPGHGLAGAEPERGDELSAGAFRPREQV